MNFKNLLRNIIFTLVILPVLITQKTETKEYQIDPILKLKLQKCLQDIYFGQKPFNDFLSQFGEQKSLDLLPIRSCNTCCPDSTIYDMTILGSVEITSSSTIVITTTNTSLNDITVLNPVVIHVPTGGHVTINGTNYTGSIKTNLSVSADQAANTFEITGNTKVIATKQTGSFSSAAFFTQANATILTIDGNLELNGQDSAYVKMGDIPASTATHLAVTDDLYIQNAFCNVQNYRASSAAAAVILYGGIEARDIVISDNNVNGGTYNSYGVDIYLYNTSIVARNLTINNNNSITTTAFSTSVHIYNISSTSAITITDALTINGNAAKGGDFAYSVIFDIYGPITAGNSIIVNGNSSTTNTTTSSSYGIYLSTNYGSSQFSCTSGPILITNNSTNAASTSSPIYGVYISNATTISSSSNFIMSNNYAYSSTSSTYYGCYVENTPGTISVNSVTIYLNGTNLGYKKFDASNAVFKNAAASANLAFSDFTIKLNSDFYGSSGGTYATMGTDYPGIVVLNSGNQT